MAGLKNIFTWSISTGNDFELCRRRHYWKKYGSWNGWDKSSSDEAKKAYLLKNMQNRWSLIGVVAEKSIMWMLKQHQSKNRVSHDDVWNKIARPELTQKWNESKEGKWNISPKKYCLLSEHYYEKEIDEISIKKQIAKQVKNCILNFEKVILPRLSSIDEIQEIKILTTEMSGDVEHFLYEGVKIYAIPDYAYKIDDKIHIHDWKAGKVKTKEHRSQLSLYALWAIEKYNYSLENIFLYIEYLNEPKVDPFQISEKDLDEVKLKLEESVGEMTEYLVNFDREKNEPLPKEEWELTADRTNCHFCNFKELCKDEFEVY